MLPGETGLSLARRWRSNSKFKNVHIIMLTARDAEVDRVAGLDAGADDFIAKPFSIRELLARIRAVLRRNTLEVAGDELSIKGLALNVSTYRVGYEEQAIKLGPTEFKLLQFLMGNPERVHSRTTLIDRVWGDDVYIDERTVDVHIKRLRTSLALAGNMVETVRGAGYRLTANPAKSLKSTL